MTNTEGMLGDCGQSGGPVTPRAHSAGSPSPTNLTLTWSMKSFAQVQLHQIAQCFVQAQGPRGTGFTDRIGP